MIAETTPSQKIASKMLARYGIAFIWEAHVAAAAAHGLGKLSLAQDLTEMVEEETAEHGYAPWEVRIPCRSHAEAKELALRLEADGYGVVRRWSYVIAGTPTRESAEELARKLHGEVEPGGELVWETTPGNPFAIFGGLGGAGTPV